MKGPIRWEWAMPPEQSCTQARIIGQYRANRRGQPGRPFGAAVGFIGGKTVRLAP